MHPPATFRITDPLPRGTVILEASAGTGKTYSIASLAARFVAEGTPLAQQMVVTFSRSATAELRARVRERLEALESALSGRSGPDDDLVAQLCQGTPEDLARRLSRVAAGLAEFDEATIATTHEFCSRMLAGLGSLAPQRGVTTFVPDLSGLVRECALDAWLAMFADETGSHPPLPLDEALLIAKHVLAEVAVPLAPEGEVRWPAQVRLDYARKVRELAHRRKTERGLTTYDDMLTLLHDALTDPVLGEHASRRLAERFPVVLIDEFQDTDPIQWAIIEKAFVPSSTVVLIGDPKQAIYGFRGADVQSYLTAVRAHARLSLTRNWRSDARLVSALNELLAGTELGHRDIVVHPVEAHHEEARLQVADPAWASPVRVRELVTDGDAPAIEAIRARLDADLCADIAGLLNASPRLTTPAGVRALTRSDIAILVRTNRSGERVLAALTRAGVPAVFAGGQSVYGSVAAQDWLTLLRALTDPTPAHVRAVALTAFHGWDFAELAEATSSQLTGLGATVRGWATSLHRDGVATLVEQVMRRGDLMGRLLGQTGGERLLTDLRHVGQALELAEAGGTGPTALYDWLSDRISEASDDERTRRLETDGEAVRIMTVHKAKGLEFPVVYLPDLGDRWVDDRDHQRPLVVHGGAGGTRVLDVAGQKDGRGRHERWRLHGEEEAGEDLRMAYVALTRAQCQVTTWWSRSRGNTAASPLQRLLFRQRHGHVAPAQSYDDEDLAVLTLPAGIELIRVADDTVPAAPGSDTSGPPVAAATFDRTIDRTWRRTSYSGLTAGAHLMAPVEAGLKEADEPDENAADELAAQEPAPALEAGPSPLAEMPGGTQFGSLVHAIFERVDPTAPDLLGELAAVTSDQAARVPVDGLSPAALATALLPVFQTPLGPLVNGLRLADISPRDRLAELDFELPLGAEDRAPTLAEVADTLAAHLPADDILARYPEALRAPGLGDQVLRGFLTGSIDAVLRVGAEPRHVIVDYKTNRLGPLGAELTLGHYTRAAMADAMIASHYPLQALLYGVATHRFLRWRLPGYSPETHLGGVLYLFVRGMGGEASVRDDEILGVFQWSPPAAAIVALSALIGGAR